MNVVRAWNRYWFDQENETSSFCPYGLFRILFVLGLGRFLPEWLMANREIAAHFPRELFTPSLALRILHLGLPSASVAQALTIVTAILYVLALVGILTRLALFGLGMITLYLGGIMSSWGFYDHSSGLPVIVFFLLAVAPAIDHYGLGRWVRTRWFGKKTSSQNQSSPVRSSPWVAKLILVLLAVTYCGSGLAKARFGKRWMTGDTLAFYLDGPKGTFFTSRIGTQPAERWRDGFGLEAFTYDAREQTKLAHKIGKSSLLCILLSVATILFETTFPLALIGRRMRTAYFLAGLGFHVGILVVMRLDFLSFVLLYALFVDWRKLPKLLKKKQRGLTHHVV
jgi:hypothetical protein